MATKMNRPEGSKGTIFNPKDDMGLDKPGYSDQFAYSGKVPKKTDADKPSSKGWWESSHGKMPWDSDAKDLINAAKEDVNCYGGPGTGRGRSQRPATRQDQTCAGLQGRMCIGLVLTATTACKHEHRNGRSARSPAELPGEITERARRAGSGDHGRDRARQAPGRGRA